MKKIIMYVCSLFLLLAASAAFSDAKKGTVSSFLEVENMIEEWDRPTTTLLVMDNDDTLTMMPCPDLNDFDNCQYLGGAAWFSWQRDLLNTSSPYKVAENITELIDISALIFSISDMEYTEQDLSDILNRIRSKGVRLMVETARGSANVAATSRQFSELAVNSKSSKNLLQLINNNSLHFPPSNLASLPSPYIPCDIPGARNISYQQGVLYLAGQNKGTMLECMLKQYKASQEDRTSMDITHIIFIDDTQKNVNNVYEAFKNNKEYTLKALHFDKLSAHKLALTKGANKDKIQKTAQQRWQTIRNALKAGVLKPAVLKPAVIDD